MIEETRSGECLEGEELGQCSSPADYRECKERSKLPERGLGQQLNLKPILTGAQFSVLRNTYERILIRKIIHWKVFNFSFQTDTKYKCFKTVCLQVDFLNSVFN